MPRDAFQVYTLPEAPFVTNTVAQPAPVNNNFADIAAALTDSFTRAETTAYTRTLLDDANATAALTTLGGTTVGRAVFTATDAAAARSAMDAQIVPRTNVTLTGSSTDFTGLPAGVGRFTVMFTGLSTNGTNAPLIQVGTSSGFVSTGYQGTFLLLDSLGVSGLAQLSGAAGFLIGGTNAAASRDGRLVLERQDGNTWVATLDAGFRGTTTIGRSVGSITLAADLDRIRITTNSADTFDAGSANVLVEF